MSAAYFTQTGFKLKQVVKVFEDAGLEVIQSGKRVYSVWGTHFILTRIPGTSVVIALDRETGLVMDLPDEQLARSLAISIRQGIRAKEQANVKQLILGLVNVVE